MDKETKWITAIVIVGLTLAVALTVATGAPLLMECNVNVTC